MTKLAFIHTMRSGGSYAGAVLYKCGLRFHCGWRAGLGRDLLRSEIMEAAEESDGVIHNHAANWDSELLAYVKARGWRTLCIVRDPCDQLVSLWHYCERPTWNCTIDEFVTCQATGGWMLKLSHYHWALPDWWPQIDVLIPYSSDLGPELCKRLGLGEVPDVERQNGRERFDAPSEAALNVVRRSVYYERCLDAMEKAA